MKIVNALLSGGTVPASECEAMKEWAETVDFFLAGGAFFDRSGSESRWRAWAATATGARRVTLGQLVLVDMIPVASPIASP